MNEAKNQNTTIPRRRTMRGIPLIATLAIINLSACDEDLDRLDDLEDREDGCETLPPSEADEFCNEFEGQEVGLQLNSPNSKSDGRWVINDGAEQFPNVKWRAVFDQSNADHAVHRVSCLTLEGQTYVKFTNDSSDFVRHLQYMYDNKIFWGRFHAPTSLARSFHWIPVRADEGSSWRFKTRDGNNRFLMFTAKGKMKTYSDDDDFQWPRLSTFDVRPHNGIAYE